MGSFLINASLAVIEGPIHVDQAARTCLLPLLRPTPRYAATRRSAAAHPVSHTLAEAGRGRTAPLPRRCKIRTARERRCQMGFDWEINQQWTVRPDTGPAVARTPRSRSSPATPPPPRYASQPPEQNGGDSSTQKAGKCSVWGNAGLWSREAGGGLAEGTGGSGRADQGASGEGGTGGFRPLLK